MDHHRANTPDREELALAESKRLIGPEGAVKAAKVVETKLSSARWKRWSARS
jgi:hypothetical protein